MSYSFRRILIKIMLSMVMASVIFVVTSFEVDASSYGRVVESNKLTKGADKGIVGAWLCIWDESMEEPPWLDYFYADGTWEEVYWDTNYSEDPAYHATRDRATWEIKDGMLIRHYMYDSEESFSNRVDHDGYTELERHNSYWSERYIAITDEGYNALKEYKASDWQKFDYDTLSVGMPERKHMELEFNDSADISFEWGSDLFSKMADKKGNFDIDIAMAAIYLCEGTYHGEDEIKSRMKELGLSEPYSDYYDFSVKAYTSPITLASDVITINDKQYLFVAVAVRGTNILDIDDLLTDINEGIFNDSGFEKSGKNGMDVVRNYCDNMREKTGIDKKHTILFVTGHSLGAAVAGQIAGNLQDEVATQNHIFAYTFASPFYQTHGKKTDSYVNIRNFINTEDAVPKAPLGGVRYGIDQNFKGKGADILDQHMLGTYLQPLQYIQSYKAQKTIITGTESGKKTIAIEWKKQSRISGYQIQYGLKKNFKGATVVTIKDPSITKKEIQKLKRKRQYYVRVRTYKRYLGNNYYSNWSKTKSISTK